MPEWFNGAVSKTAVPLRVPEVRILPSPLIMNLKNKKILVFGLGVLGGGVATTNWLLKKGAKVTITDLKRKEDLKTALKKINGKAALALGGHSKKDIKDNEVIVFNPDVSFRNKYVSLARKSKKQIENEATLYYKHFNNPKIAVTGTRGKTTTTAWIAHFTDVPAVGNSSTNPFMKMADKRAGIGVTELPSYLLELFDRSVPAPYISIITNVYRDHMNRYRSLEDYARIKANVFKFQKAEDYLILNYGDKWTNFFLKQKPKAQVLYFSQKKLPRKVNSIFLEDRNVFYQSAGETQKVLDIKDFLQDWGEHNGDNLLAALLAARLAGVSWSKMSKRIKSLPQVPFRQEVIYKDKKIEIINDTTATSPEGGIAAINRFASPSCVLLSGGTDRNLEFKEWGKMAKRSLKKENILLLSGSATDKMLRYLKGVKAFDSFEELVSVGLRKALRYKKSVLLFSPASKSFEKFKNEYDRGKQFNKFIKKWKI